MGDSLSLSCLTVIFYKLNTIGPKRFHPFSFSWAIWGENDTVIPQAHADLLVANAPDARKVVIAGAGHASYLDKPDEFHNQLIRFMKGLGRPPSAITSPKKTRSEP